MSTSEAQKAYSRGYATASKRVRDLERQIAELKAALQIAPDRHDATIEYTIHVASVMVSAASVLIGARASKEETTHD